MGVGHVKLNVACGRRPLHGYVNIDLVRYEGVNYAGLAFFQREDGLRFLAACRRVIAPGGTLRLTVPDLGAHLADIHDGAQRVPLPAWLKALPGEAPYRPEENVLLFVLYAEGHRCVYNESMLRAALAHTGWAVETLARPDGANLAAMARPR